MHYFAAVVERDIETDLFVGYVLGLPVAHTQADSLEKLHSNLREVIDMLCEDGEPVLESQFVGIQMIGVR